MKNFNVIYVGLMSVLPVFCAQKMNQSTLFDDPSSELNRSATSEKNDLSQQSSLGSAIYGQSTSLTPQLQSLTEPAPLMIPIIEPSQATFTAVEKKNSSYFQQHPDLLTDSLPYFLYHDLDSDQTKKNAINILNIMSKQAKIITEQGKEIPNASCAYTITSTIKEINRGNSSERYTVAILNAYDKEKFSIKSVVQAPEQSKIDMLKSQLEQLKAQRMLFAEVNQKPTSLWQRDVKNLFETISSDIIQDLSKLSSSISTQDELEKTKAAILETIKLMIESIKALDSTIESNSDRLLKLMRMHSFIKAMTLETDISKIDVFIKNIKKIKTATIQIIQNPNALESSTLLMEKAGVDIEVTEARAKRKDILAQLRKENSKIKKATIGIRLSKTVDPKYINLLQKHITTLNEYLRQISSHERELKIKIKKDILDNLDRIDSYITKTSNLPAYPSLEKPSIIMQCLMDMDESLVEDNIELLKNAFQEFYQQKQLSHHHYDLQSLSLEKISIYKNLIFELYNQAIQTNQNSYELVPFLLNQIHHYKYLSGLGNISAAITESNQKILNSILNSSGQENNQNIVKPIKLIDAIVKSPDFDEKSKQACLMLSCLILAMTGSPMPAVYKNFFDTIHKTIEDKFTTLNIISDIAQNYYEQEQKKGADAKELVNNVIKSLTILPSIAPLLTEKLQISDIAPEKLEDYLERVSFLQQNTKSTSPIYQKLTAMEKNILATKRSKQQEVNPTLPTPAPEERPVKIVPRLGLEQSQLPDQPTEQPAPAPSTVEQKPEIQIPHETQQQEITKLEQKLIDKESSIKKNIDQIHKLSNAPLISVRFSDISAPARMTIDSVIELAKHQDFAPEDIEKIKQLSTSANSLLQSLTHRNEDDPIIKDRIDEIRWKDFDEACLTIHKLIPEFPIPIIISSAPETETETKARQSESVVSPESVQSTIIQSPSESNKPRTSAPATEPTPKITPPQPSTAPAAQLGKQDPYSGFMRTTGTPQIAFEQKPQDITRKEQELVDKKSLIKKKIEKIHECNDESLFNADETGLSDCAQIVMDSVIELAEHRQDFEPEDIEKISQLSKVNLLSSLTFRNGKNPVINKISWEKFDRAFIALQIPDRFMPIVSFPHDPTQYPPVATAKTEEEAKQYRLLLEKENRRAAKLEKVLGSQTPGEPEILPMPKSEDPELERLLGHTSKKPEKPTVPAPTPPSEQPQQGWPSYIASSIWDGLKSIFYFFARGGG